MSVASFVADDRFIVRLIKSHINNPSDAWANSYEFVATTSGTESALLALGVAVTDFEKAIHKNVINFVRMTISTWEEDSKPYDPDAFISTILTGVGAVGVVGGAVALNETLSVARVCPTGRFGHLFYRGVLDSADVTAPAGKNVLLDRGGIQEVIDDAVTSSALENYIGVGSTEALSMAMINKAGTQVRTVLGLSVIGVSALPLDHAWFNRTSPTP